LKAVSRIENQKTEEYIKNTLDNPELNPMSGVYHIVSFLMTEASLFLQCWAGVWGNCFPQQAVMVYTIALLAIFSLFLITLHRIINSLQKTAH
jgi:hypothetical protein